MIERALSKTDIRTLLDRLSERLREKRAFAKIHVVGSACIALAYERERTELVNDTESQDLLSNLRRCARVRWVDPDLFGK